MQLHRWFWVILVSVLAQGPVARGEVLTFLDEAAYLAELQARGYTPLVEDFEGSDWDHVRSDYPVQNAAPSVTSQPLTWSGNEPVSTNQNWGRFGTWGIFTVYTPPVLTLDELYIDSDVPLFGAGGWIDANASADIAFEINGQVVADRPISGLHRFLGVIDTCGFDTLRIVDLEAHSVWGADDFTFAVGGGFVDCNSNGRSDACDLAGGTSSDCDATGVPDRCEIEAGSAVDCNTNHLPDACEVVAAEVFEFGPRSPFGASHPQSFTVIAPPVAQADVIIDLAAYANLGGSNRFVDVRLNDVPVGTVFTSEGTNCPEAMMDVDRLIVARDVYRSAVGDRDAVIALVASPAVVAVGECDLSTSIQVSMTVFGAAAADANGNGVLDACESEGDLDGDGDVDLADYAVLSDCLQGPVSGEPPPSCSLALFSAADFDGDGDVDLRDFSLWHETLTGNPFGG